MKNKDVVPVRVTLLTTAVLLALVVSACGGGGGGGGAVRPDPPPATPQPPQPPQPPVVYPPSPSMSQHLVLTGAGTAQTQGITGKGVTIGVIDSGVNRNHPALKGKVTANLVYLSSPPNNLAVDDVVGHGTAVAQIAAGKPFGTWPGGIAPGANIVSARIISDKAPTDDGSGQGNEVDGALGIAPIHQDLIDRGARIMNNSWGGLYWTKLEATAPIAAEYRPFVIGHDGLVVFSTGNSGFANPSDTAALPSKAGVDGSRPGADLERGWLAVAALDPDTRALASYSNACGVAMNYCLVAPGSVVVTGTNDAPASPSYWNWKGTSFSAPIVSGAAALVWEKFPYFNNDLVRQTLLGTAQDLGAYGVDAVFGWGLLDIASALKGPTAFEWGDVDVSFDQGTSIWSNFIDGPGGLVKRGSGTLVIENVAYYTGNTRVEQGVLRVERGLNGTASVTISQGAELQLRDSAGLQGGVTNDGTLSIHDVYQHGVNGNYVQATGARLAIEVGASLLVHGTAQLNGGGLHVLGKADGYVPSATQRERFLTAIGGLNGTFGSLTTAPGVFLEANLGYGQYDAWLDITRLDVTTAAQSMGLSPTSLSGAQRLEGAFQVLDDEMSHGRSPAGIAGETVAQIAGNIQRTPDVVSAERTLSSLAGELHAADTAFALMAVDGSRHALESRIDGLHQGTAEGSWAERLEGNRSGWQQMELASQGWLMGQDYRMGDTAFGVAFSQSEGQAWHALRNDREQNRQIEGQLYAAWSVDNRFAIGRLASGRIERRMQRDLLLGASQFGAGSEYSNRYDSVSLQFGQHLADGALTPYLGAQVLRMDRGGFVEREQVGFGLAAGRSSLELSQALLGARATKDWLVGGSQVTLTARAEWQRVLSQRGLGIDARFNAIDVWSPIHEAGLPRDAAVWGLGVDWLTRYGRLGVELDGRVEQEQAWTQAMARWSMTF